MTRLLQQFRAVFPKRRPRDADATDWLRTILLTSVGVTALVLGMRQLKWLQPLELKAYDQMLRLRPTEKPDPRILLVTITEEDLQRQQAWPLPDSTYNTLLAKLESYQPRFIGLNIYRNLPHEPGHQEFTTRLKRQNNIITICYLGGSDDPEIPPPPNVPTDRVGFTDVIPDQDGIVRRSLLFASENEKCKTPFSLGALLALSYLQKQGIEPVFLDTQDFKLGDTVFRTLRPNSGSYENIDAAGYQILLNYRSSPQIAQEVTLSQVLNNQVNPSWVKDRLVIIGTTASSIEKGFYTPYSAIQKQQPRIPGIVIHAQMASEILSAVLDGRQLIWYLPDWAEVLWVWGWSLVGGVLAWQLRHPLLLMVVGSTTLTGLLGICTVLFLAAGWVPLVPPALAFVITGVSVMGYTTYQTQQKQKEIIQQVQEQEQAIVQLNTLLKETTIAPDDHLDFAAKLDTGKKTTGQLLLGGRYKITKALASGGFGYTYLAEDTQRPGNPICVVKQLMPARRDTRFLQVARRLFHTEAEILEALGKHNQIPELLAYFEDNQEFYLVQEYIDGHPLSDELRLDKRVENEEIVIDIIKGILEVLAFVHDHRVIHRDIKPSNIIRRDADHRLVLIDFGAVKLMQTPNSEQTELATVAIGTRGYTPPEQFAGHPRLSSDIYALGMIGIQAVTGLPTHELKPDPETGNIVWRQWAHVSAELATILDKMVCYHFNERYQSAAEVLQELKRIGE